MNYNYAMNIARGAGRGALGAGWSPMQRKKKPVPTGRGGASYMSDYGRRKSPAARMRGGGRGSGMSVRVGPTGSEAVYGELMNRNPRLAMGMRSTDPGFSTPDAFSEALKRINTGGWNNPNDPRGGARGPIRSPIAGGMPPRGVRRSPGGTYNPATGELMPGIMADYGPGGMERARTVANRPAPGDPGFGWEADYAPGGLPGGANAINTGGFYNPYQGQAGTPMRRPPTPMPYAKAIQSPDSPYLKVPAQEYTDIVQLPGESPGQFRARIAERNSQIEQDIVANEAASYGGAPTAMGSWMYNQLAQWMPEYAAANHSQLLSGNIGIADLPVEIQARLRRAMSYWEWQ